ncbi:MAG: exonuclease SbcCD subunit D [Candidatus Bipolaricaulia bacterium]
MTQVLHTADTHIGTRQYGLEDRRKDFSQAFAQVIQIAIEEEVAAVIHAGDLFDDRYPSTEDLGDVLRELTKLNQVGIPFLGIVGNHERRRGAQWIDLFAELGLAVHLGAEPTYVGDIVVYGLDYSGRREIELPELDDGVLVAHQMLDQVQVVDGELKLEALVGCGARIVLLGDYHQHKVWRQDGVLITYPGSTERWSLDEVARRGFNLIDLETGRLTRREFDTRRFIYIAGNEDPIRGIDAHPVTGAVVAVYLKKSGHTVKEIEEYGLTNGALAVQVRDRREDDVGLEQIEVSVEFGDLDRAVSERLDRMELSETSREIDHITRDREIADSNVDSEVDKLLTATGGSESDE